MRERPILFSAPMVRAILSGQKTQTRRAFNDKANWHFIEGQGDLSICPYGQPGDHLWVRETWQHANHPDGPYRPGVPVHYRADYIDDPHGPDGEKSHEGRYRTWRPSIHMPRSASRITLEITGVRIERLQDINEADCWAEGIAEVDGLLDDVAICDLAKRMGRSLEDAAPSFAALWESINGPRSWGANPWVWVVGFRRAES